MSPTSEHQIEELCNRFDISLEDFADILSDPKIAPVLRKKSAEIAAEKRLEEDPPEVGAPHNSA